jgi:hypothetical protein
LATILFTLSSGSKAAKELNGLKSNKAPAPVAVIRNFCLVQSLLFVIFYDFQDVSLKMTGNVLALGAVPDFGAQNCQYATKVDAR